MPAEKFRHIYSELLEIGRPIKPRGEECLEIENWRCTFAPYERFISFKSRKLNLSYIKKEFLWYLKGDRYDTSITEHASMWKNLINEDGSINSNYGQYIFNSDCNQFQNVANILLKDKDSRRASIIILHAGHLFSKTNDYPCTYSINFRIRENKLNMSVHMRSQDAVYGLGNDLPCFSFIHEMMYVYLKNTKYADLEYGNYFHNADSFHIYRKHYEMANIIAYKDDEYIPVECPKISNDTEVNKLIRNDYPYNISSSFQYWLNS